MKIVVVSALVLMALGLAQSHQSGEEDGRREQSRPRARELGLRFGVLPTGPLNLITDVEGVKVGHLTLIEGESLRTGITAILPHGGNIFLDKVPGAAAVGNGFGKLAGSTQVNELGQIETPILLTNTLSVPQVADGLIEYMLSLPGMESVRSINPLVAETNDGSLNDIRRRPFGPESVRAAIEAAAEGRFETGCVGAGTGTICFGFKGGIGSASRKLPESLGGWTVGVLVQTNFGGVLTINGVEAGRLLGKYPYKEQVEQDPGGSIIMVVATDAPLTHRNLRRLADRALLGMARTGGYGSNGSGDYVIAFSTNAGCRIRSGGELLVERPVLDNNAMSPLFLATVEATEEAIIDSLFTATTTRGRDGHVIEALPADEILRQLGEQTK
ncbi:MAG TPA: P1 family peptidase [Acidobacteriota bacterium]|nr:P1 family peptidase [Acidobacteriota bacterium]